MVVVVLCLCVCRVGCAGCAAYFVFLAAASVLGFVVGGVHMLRGGATLAGVRVVVAGLGGAVSIVQCCESVVRQTRKVVVQCVVVVLLPGCYVVSGEGTWSVVSEWQESVEWVIHWAVARVVTSRCDQTCTLEQPCGR